MTDEVPASLASTAVKAAERVAVGLCPAATGVSASAARLSVRVHRALSRGQLLVSGANLFGGFAVLTLMTSLLVAAGQPGASNPSEKADEAPKESIGTPGGDAPSPEVRDSSSPLREAALAASLERLRPPEPSTEVRRQYESLARQAEGDADAQVELALWCESHGLADEKSRHLSLAVLRRPDDPRARGLLGLASYEGRWKRPEAVASAVAKDTGLAASLAAYNVRRDRTPNSADAQWKLALWCEQSGLKPEATAHLVQATRLDPGHDAAWKHLGCKRVNGRWVSQEQVDVEKLEARRQKEANRIWTSLLSKWRGWLGETDPARQADAEQALSGVSDPYAVPAVWSSFARGPERSQRRAVQLFGQIDAPTADLALGVLALSSPHANVRKSACETLRLRDARAAFDLLVGLLRDPEPNPRSPLVRWQILPTGALGIGSPGVVYVEGPNRAVLGIFTVDESLGGLSVYSTVANAAGLPEAIVGPGYDRRIAMQRHEQFTTLGLTYRAFLTEALADVLPVIVRIRQGNERVMETLRNIHGTSPGDTWEDWKRWWVEQRGYAYDPGQFKNPVHPLESADKPVSVERYHLSCFAAGTPVRTLTGRRPIESVRVGDRVLTQDVETGALSYTPVLAALQNRPAPTVRVELEGVEKPVVTTDIHRFWKPGRGWVMARELTPGDRIRTLGGLSRVVSISAEAVQPVYNLEVGQTQSFFVGDADALVHDNSGVSPVSRPFDRVIEH
ncbi:MAG: polymorphic toxin-type HINT domain-containing protein [Isosphaeraceae bacterium]